MNQILLRFLDLEMNRILLRFLDLEMNRILLRFLDLEMVKYSAAQGRMVGTTTANPSASVRTERAEAYQYLASSFVVARQARMPHATTLNNVNDRHKKNLDI